MVMCIFDLCVKTMGLLVAAKVLWSGTHGRGLFADCDLPAGTVVWKFDASVDKAVSSQSIGRKRYWRFDNFAYYDKDIKKWVYHMDKTNGSTTHTHRTLKIVEWKWSRSGTSGVVKSCWKTTVKQVVDAKLGHHLTVW